MDCDAVGGTRSERAGTALITKNGGKNWVIGRLPPGIGVLDAISCPSSSVCEAVGVDRSGQAGVALRTQDAGMTWVGQKLPAGMTGFEAVVCPAPSVCEALGLTPTDAIVLRLA